MSKKNQHVVPHAKAWAVRPEAATQPSSTHGTQAAAIERARSEARAQQTELLVHGRSGQIRERSSFGNDPVRRKG
jgi:non-canonical (house-cleaning) NTP pyrophosphatase